MENVYIKGLRIAYQCKGKGQDLVLLHGALSDSRVWKNQIDDFSNIFSVTVWDNPGCGLSADPPENFRLSDFADYLELFLKTLGIKNPHILGLSFGAGLALEFYHRYPAFPKTLILASAYAGWAGSLPPEVVRERFHQGIQQSYLPPNEVVNKWISTLFTESVPKNIIEQTAAIMTDFHPAGMRTMLSAFAEADLREMLPTINIPTLLLYGDKDKRSPLSIANELNKNIPSSKLVIIPDSGHDINVEKPEVFNEEVFKFLGPYC